MLQADGAIYGRLATALDSSWALNARPNQLAPPGDWWSIWLVLAGRGWGKTRSGVEYIKGLVETAQARRIALVTSTAADGRDVLVEGASGFLAVSSPWCFPHYEPSKRRLSWPNGATATLFSAEEADRLRGPQFDAALCDELAAWSDPSAFDMLMFGLRLGKRPRCCIMTTPRPTKIIRDLLSREGKDVAVTRGTSFENKDNLAPSFFASLVRRYEGTRLGRQELSGELLDDVVGALWQREWIDNVRLEKAPADLARVVVAIDPAVTAGEDSDETGIIVAALEGDHAFVLEDLSGRHPPHEWAQIAITAYHRHKADLIVGEANQGGDMIEALLRQVDPNVAYKSVHASRGKVTRAEPAAALYEQGRVHHCGTFNKLEDQLCAFTTDFDRKIAGYSPDRVDALVWALTELLIQQVPGLGLLRWYELEVARLGLTGMLPGDETLPPKPEEQPTTKMRAPLDWATTFFGANGCKYLIEPGATAAIFADDVPALRRMGFEEVTA